MKLPFVVPGDRIKLLEDVVIFRTIEESKENNPKNKERKEDGKIESQIE